MTSDWYPSFLGYRSVFWTSDLCEGRFKMRQSMTAGRVPGSARRLALTSLGAGLAVAAAAPMASAATTAQSVPAAAPATSSGLASAATIGSAAADANAIPVAAAGAQTEGAPLSVPESAPVASFSAPSDRAPLTAPESAHDSASVTSAAGLADNAVTVSDALAGMAAPTWARLGRFRLYPLAGTGIDPLSNVVGTKLGGIPVSTQPVTDAFSDGLPVAELPVIGTLLGSERD